MTWKRRRGEITRGCSACIPVVLGVVALGCGGPKSGGFDFGDGSVADGRSGGGADVAVRDAGGEAGRLTTGSGSGSGSGMGTTGDASEDCPPSAKLIYVTGEGSKLYSFNPESAQFTLIGPLTCLESPTHMTVDRTGTAWVVSNGMLYKASTATAACSAVSTWTSHPFKFADFALTFIGTTNATDNSLYMLGGTGELGVFDVASGTVTSAGTLTISTAGDMTSNGDGTLYFLQQDEAQTLNQLNPANAAVLNTYSTGLDSENTQALAFYGGLFFDFIGSAVYTFDVSTKAVKSLGTAPLLVTGAGQSTCVPTSAPPPPLLP
jgi:hypothetical protein